MSVKCSDLNRTSRGDLRKVFTEILDLKEGGRRIELAKDYYIVKRPDETAARYQNRLAKFVYTNLLGDLVRDYAARLSKGNIFVDGTEDSRWSRTLENLDGQGGDVMELAKVTVEDLMTFGETLWYVDKGKGGDGTALGDLSYNVLPYAVRIDPESVCDYESDHDGLVWVRWKTETTVRDPLGVSSDSLIRRWYIATREVVQVWVTRNKETVATLEDEVYHALDRCPVVLLREPSLWVASQARLKAVQHLNVENGLTDTATIAGYIQRIFTPSRQVTENADTLVDEDYAESLRQIKTSNNHLLIGERFDFAEAQGKSIQSVSGLLDKIERQIRDIVSLGGVYESQGTVQSGRSKEVEYQLSNEQMMRFGQSVRRVLGDILGLVERRLGITVPMVSVAGLDRFDDGATGAELATALDKPELLGPTAFEILRGRYLQGLVGDVEGATWEQIINEGTTGTLVP